MSRRKIKLLAIAPSESIQSQLYEIVSSMDQVDMDAYVGNLYSGVEIVQQRSSIDYDAILSRGETASMIKKVTPIPVIEFPLSFYDVLHAMKLADNFNEPYAIVGFTPVTNSAHLLRDLLQLDLDIHTLFTLEEAVPLMERLKNKGYRLIVSGMGIDSIARRNGLNSILITTGRESLTSAIDQAVRLCTTLAQVREKEEFLRGLLEQSDHEMLVFNKEKELIFSSLKTIKKDLAVSIASRRLQNIQQADSTIVKANNGMIITVREKNVEIADCPFTIFYFSQQKKPYNSPKNEIRVFSRGEAVDTFLYHYLELSSSGYDASQSLQQIILSPYPVMILGENGAGKEQIAATIYTQGKYQNHPYVVIDFELATDKTWTYLLNHVNSPINSQEITLYFRNIEKLTAAKTDKLKSVLYDTGLCRRNRVILSYTTMPGEKMPSHILNLVNQLSCLTIRMVPLRERSNEIQALASLYISTVNIDLAKQIIGFTPQAMALIESYQWPGNLTQFKRVITQLVTNAASSYIQEESVKRMLESENSNLASSSALSSVLNLNKPLEDIQRDIVKAVLSETGGNQSQAAARLGICRTTLWRIMNK
ncbi:propionate catabolism operon regulatory protein PrpR [Clostridium sp. chh4-2]|uniref:sigma-54-dependent transcriptional regulator n=1 Tax=Clostridium sp. chh4-2 TaxID=2067550 RepID=UPI000CCF9860|nr:sigma-54-dependent transcriptional regulator [Clostridium sp. chh4-2]PNV62383.1 propionate catabolism operon regulatory protein PrpR [Clostridium sp. chh4-2]